MSKVVIDTDIYIDFLRTGALANPIRGLYTFRTPDICFSTVVAEELLQGTDDPRGRKAVESLYRPFEKAGRMLTPIYSDWLETGDVLSQIRRKKKEYRTKISHLINDTLITVSARRTGAVVYTSNQRDFELIAQIRNFRFEIIER